MPPSTSLPGCEPLHQCRGRRGFSSTDTQKNVLDNFSCSGLMVSTPGKMRSCTGPILFTVTRGLFLKTFTEVAKKNQKFQIQLVQVREKPFLGHQGIFASCFLFHPFSEYSPSSFSNREAAVAARPPWDSREGKPRLDCCHSFLIPDGRQQLNGMHQCVTEPDEPTKSGCYQRFCTPLILIIKPAERRWFP